MTKHTRAPLRVQAKLYSNSSVRTLVEISQLTEFDVILLSGSALSSIPRSQFF